MPKIYESRTDETKAVKRALAVAGIASKVTHGAGTAWGWLDVNIGSPADWVRAQHDGATRPECSGLCPACAESRDRQAEVLRIVLATTGRTGEYSGKVQILTQRDFCRRCDGSVPVGHRHTATTPADA